MKKRFYFILLMCLLGCLYGAAQQVTSVAGKVVDADTGETLPFVQIYFIKNGTEGTASSVGTTSDMDGNFSIKNTEGYTTLLLQMMGYKTEMLTLRVGQTKKNEVVKLQPDVYALQDIVVTPKHRKQKYKRKGNPAVELIQNVIAHKDSGNVKTADHYTAKTYSRMSFALNDFHPNFSKGIWKVLDFAEKYIDTTGTYPSLTVSIRENTAEEYYQLKPRRNKRIIKRRRIFGIEDQIDAKGMQENIDAIFRDVDIYDNDMNLLSNRFVSPLSSTLAVSYYQYYIMDTIMVDGESCIDLAFVPVNSESYSFTGHLYILNDSTFKLKRYAINIPPHINLNFVSDYSVEHNYVKLDNGLWAPDRTNVYAKMYVIRAKKGVLTRQTKLYTGWDFETPIDKEVFSSLTPDEPSLNDSNALRLPSVAWDTIRPEPLTKYEASAYDLVQEFVNTPKLNSLMMLGNALGSEFVTTTSGNNIDESKWDFGPIYNFVSWNELEGVRLRLGGVSTAKMNPNMFFHTYVAFGTHDLRPKYNMTLLYSFNEKKKHAYEPYRHYLSLMAQYDVEEPGEVYDVLRRDHILNSIPMSKPNIPTLKNYQYVFHTKLTYLKEWPNNLSLKGSFDFTNNEAAGAMRYDRILSYTPQGNIRLTKQMRDYRCYEGEVELKYSPSALMYVDRLGYQSPFALNQDAPIITINHKMGYLDDRHHGGLGFYYNTTELSAKMRFWFSSFGHLDALIKTGKVWNKVPFTKLYAPSTSTSIFLAQNSFNLMRPMEFLMDQYLSWHMTYYFKGWILNRIPGINRLKLRGVVSFAGVYGGLTDKNNPFLSSGTGLYRFPENAVYDEEGQYISGYTCSPIGKVPYMELTAGFENIFKFLRIDYVRRLNYNDYLLPDGIHRKKVGAWGRNGVKITVRFAL